MSLQSRRAVLRSAVVATVTLAGCLSAESSVEPATETNTVGSATETQTSRPLNCEYAARPLPEAGTDDEVSPTTYPDPPDHPVSTAWVVDHERAYRRNDALANYEVTFWSGLAVRETERDERRSGVIVRIAYTYGMTTETGARDSPVVRTAYYVDERGAFRAKETGSDGEWDLEPSVDGSPVVCF